MRSLAVLAMFATSCGVITGIEVTAPPTTTERATPFPLLDAYLGRGDVVLVFYRGHW